MSSLQLTSQQLVDLTYVPALEDFTLGDNLPRLPKDWSYCSQSPASPFPTFDSLPPELLHSIFSQLDLVSLHNFRRVSRRAAELIYSDLECNAIITHAWDAIRGAHCIKTARKITCGALYKKLCTQKCEGCGDFGGYLYLLTLKRVCFLCFSEGRYCFPMTPKFARRRYSISTESVRKASRMRGKAGIYSPSRVRMAEPVLVDSEDIVNIVRGVLDLLRRLQDDYWSQLETENPQPVPRLAIQDLEDPLLTSDEKLKNPHRFAAIVSAPWLDSSTQQPEQGLHCLACKGREAAPFHWRRKFTASSFEEHLRECGQIEDGKHHVKPGE
ncbi:F-box domain-containing [Fusarium albosuccineum]|uniref:F-box domain-containing n=1 Tax=Fusarium albosuccineum TaxID=1237068 RepID=A0A8H4LQ32_9HYPO|nr:F-box domain-containing [Fusarium albosuccineum]